METLSVILVCCILWSCRKDVQRLWADKSYSWKNVKKGNFILETENSSLGLKFAKNQSEGTTDVT